MPNYQSALRVYPFGVGGGGPPGNVVNRWSAQSQLLPYLEQPALFNALNFVGIPWLNLNPVFGPMNQTAITTRIARLPLPDRRRPDRRPAQHGPQQLPGLRRHAPVQPEKRFAGPHRPEQRGILVPECGVPAQVTDGLSMTAFFSERCLGNTALPDPLSDYYLTNDHSGRMPVSGAGQFAPADRPVRVVGRSLGRRELALYSLQPRPPARQYPSCLLGGSQDYDSQTVVTATSRHPGGVNLMTGDGSVRFVKASDERKRLDGPGDDRGGRGDRCECLLSLSRLVSSTPDLRHIQMW